MKIQYANGYMLKRNKKRMRGEIKR